MTLRDLSYCEPPAEPIGQVIVMPPAVPEPIVGELLEPIVDGELVHVAVPVRSTTRGLRWRHDQVRERDIRAVRDGGL